MSQTTFVNTVTLTDAGWFNDVDALTYPPTLLGSALTFSKYTAASAACAGAIITAAVWKLTQIGNLVTLEIPAVTGNGVAVANIDFGTLIPVQYRPSENVMGGVVSLTNNGAALATPGVIFVLTTGVIRVCRDALNTTAFTVTATAGINTAATISWSI